MPIVFGTVQSARDLGQWKAYHFRTRISTCIYGTVRVTTALFRSFQTCCAKRRSATFLCKNCSVTHNRLQGRRDLKQWGAMARKSPRQKVPRCSVGIKEHVGFYTRFWHDISQLILWIDLHKGHRYELRPTILLQPFEQKWWTLCDSLLGKCWILQKVLTWYLPAHSADLSSQGP